MSNEGRIVVQAYKNLVSVTLSGIKAADFEESVGLLGHYKTGDMLARDGRTIINDADAFGNEWQVHPDEDGFQTNRVPVYPTECHMPDPNKKLSRRLGAAAVDESAAIEACASANWNEDSMERCVYDVLATQDLGMAAAGIF